MSLKYKHTLVMVDDEVPILNALNRLFRKEGYTLLTASSGEEGLELLKKFGKPVSLIVSDQRMPGISGAQFLEKAKELFPDAFRFLLTGHTDMDAIVDAVNRGEIHRYLTKPWNDKDLILQVRQAMELYELQYENKRLLALTKKQNTELNEINRELEEKVRARTAEISEKNTQLSRLNKALEENLLNTVRAFGSLAEMQAPELAGHGRRTAGWVRQMANSLEMPEAEKNQLEVAALLHDIGKLGFSKKMIEYKERIWTEEDQRLYRRHPREGQTIVQFIDSLEPVGRLIRHHHERHDGSGFPDGLAEDAIPLGARMIAVADAYDRITGLKQDMMGAVAGYLRKKTLTTDRFDDGVLRQAAAEHLKQHAFILYDPEVVRLFLELLKTQGYKQVREKAVSVTGLKAGMVLARSVYTSRGRFLLSHDTRLTGDYIEKLTVIHHYDPVEGEIYVVESE